MAEVTRPARNIDRAFDHVLTVAGSPQRRRAPLAPSVRPPDSRQPAVAP